MDNLDHSLVVVFRIKCVVDDDEETYIKDTGLLLQSLDIEHPVGQYVVSVCKSFHCRHGNGTKSLLCIIGLLMKTSTSLQSQNVPVCSIIKTLRECIQLCCDQLEHMKISLQSRLVIQKPMEPVEGGHSGHKTAILDQTTETLLNLNSGKELDHGCSNLESSMTKSNTENISNCIPSQLNEYPLKQLDKELSCLPEQEQPLSVGSCDIVHLKLANQNEEDSDIDWFFEPEPFEGSKDTKVDFLKTVNNASIGHVTSLDNQSDSDFEDCFDDIPSVVKFDFQENQKNNGTKMTTNSDTDSYRNKHDLHNSPKYNDGGLQCVNTDGIMRQKSISKCSKADESLKDSLIVGKSNCSIPGNFNINVTEISCNTKTNVNDRTNVSESGICENNSELCFGQNQDRFDFTAQQNVSKSDINKSSVEKSQPSARKPVSDLSLTEIQNLMKDLNISKPTKSVTTLRILNSTRHFKTVASTLQEVNISKDRNSQCQDVTCVEEKGFVLTDLHNSQSSGSEEISKLSNSVCHKAMNSLTKTCANMNTNSKTKQDINVTSTNSMLDMIHHRQPMKNNQKTSLKESLIRSRHFRDDLNITSENEVEIKTDKNDEKKTRTLTFDHLYASGSNGYNLPVYRSSGQIDDVQIPENNVTEIVQKEMITQSLASCRDSVKSLAQSLCHGDSVAMDIVVKGLINQWKDRMYTNISDIRLDVSQLHCCTMLGPVLEEPDIVPGLVLPVTSYIMSQITVNKQLNTLLVNGDITPSFHHTGYKKTVESKVIYTSCHRQSTDKGDNWLSQIQQLLNQLSVEMLLVKGKVSEDVMVMCESLGIVVIETVPFRVLQTISNSADIPMVVYITDINQDNICNNIRMKYYHDNWMMKNKAFYYIVIDCSSVPFQTVMYSNPTRHACDIMEQEFWRCASILSSTLEFGYVLPGSGMAEVLCAEYLLQEAERRIMTSVKSLDTDPHFYVVLEEFSNSLKDYQRLVVRNSNRDSSALRSTKVVEQLCHCTENLLKRDKIMEKMKSEQPEPQVKGEMCMRCRKILIDGAQHGIQEIPIFDDYNSKLDSWNVALKTVVTVLQTDSYIITGVTNEIKTKKSYKHSTIL